MTWVKLDDHIDEHPKVEAASPEAMWLFVCGLAYCNRTLSDGEIPKARLRKMTTARKPDALATELVAAGLWHDEGDRWIVHDFLDYQPSKAKVEADREAARKRQEKFRQGRAGSNGVTDDVTSDSPDPDPLPDVDTSSDDDQSSTPGGSSSGHPHWAAIAAAGQIAARDRVPQPSDPDAFATKVARNIEREQGWAIPELLRLRPDLEDRDRLAYILATDGAHVAIERAKEWATHDAVLDDLTPADALPVTGGPR